MKKGELFKDPTKEQIKAVSMGYSEEDFLYGLGHPHQGIHKKMTGAEKNAFAKLRILASRSNPWSIIVFQSFEELAKKLKISTGLINSVLYKCIWNNILQIHIQLNSREKKHVSYFVYNQFLLEIPLAQLKNTFSDESTEISAYIIDIPPLFAFPRFAYRAMEGNHE